MDQMILKYSFFKTMLNLVFRKIKGILMSKIKVLKNFSCNGIKKKIGQFLSKEDKDIIGEKFGKELLHNDFLLPEGRIIDAPKAHDMVPVLIETTDAILSGPPAVIMSKDDFEKIKVAIEHQTGQVPEGAIVPVGMILDELDKPGLWKYAKDLGLNPHHNTGGNKLKEMIKKKLEA